MSSLPPKNVSSGIVPSKTADRAEKIKWRIMIADKNTQSFALTLFKESKLIWTLWQGERTWTLTFSKKVTNMSFLLRLLRNFFEPLVRQSMTPSMSSGRQGQALTFRSEGQWQLPGDRLTPAWPASQQLSRTFCCIEGGPESKSSQCFLWWACHHWYKTLQRD